MYLLTWKYRLGPDVVFDAAATPSTFAQGLASLRTGGTYWAYGVFRENASTLLPRLTNPILTYFQIPDFNVNLIPMRRLTLKGAAGYDDHIFPAVIKALDDGRLNHDLLRSWITGRIELEDTQEKGLRELAERKSEHIKILVRVNDI